MDMTICMIGLGYVGGVCCGCFARQGHRVIGVDINAAKVEAVQAGISPVLEPGLEKLIRQGVSDGRLSATKDLKAALEQSDVAMVCVGTPNKKGGFFDLTHLTRVSREVARCLEQLQKDIVLIYRSTILPGLLEKFVFPILYQEARLSPERVPVVFNPEFLREGNAVEDFFHPPKTVLGLPEGRKDIGDQLLKLYNFDSGEKIFTDVGSAQMVKYADNIFHGLKITFANEIGAVCRALDIDAHRVMDIFCKDTKLNLSQAYLTPGKPYGGSCLTKDIRAFCRAADQLKAPTTLIKTIEQSNQAQIDYILHRIRGFEKKRIGLIGLTFKPETDDVRNSVSLQIAAELRNEHANLRVYDPNLRLKNLTGANLEILLVALPDIESVLCIDPDTFFNDCDLYVVFNDYPDLGRQLRKLGADKTIMDLVRVKEAAEGRAAYYGLYW